MKQALTLRANGRLAPIICDVGIIPAAIDFSETLPRNLTPFKGIWDTGATNSVITRNVIEALNLQSFGITRVHTANGVRDSKKFLVDMILPSKVIVRSLQVTEGELSDINVLIGMDVINLGDFTITNFKGKTVMSFRTPSCEEVDYIPNINKQNEEEYVSHLNRHQRRAFDAQKRKL